MSVETTPEAIQHVIQLATGHIVDECGEHRGAAWHRRPARRRPARRRARARFASTRTRSTACCARSRAWAFSRSRPAHVYADAGGGALQDGPVRAMALWIAGAFNFRVYADAMHSVKTGESAVQATLGTGVFEHFAATSDTSKIFNDAMTGFSRTVIPAVLEAYDFSRIGRSSTSPAATARCSRRSCRITRR